MPIVKALWFTLLLALANAAHAQDAPPPMHKFWDAQNTTIIVSVAALRAAEPDSIAHNTPALAAYSAAMVIVTATHRRVGARRSSYGCGCQQFQYSITRRRRNHATR